LHRIRAISLDLDDTLWAINPVIYEAEASLWRWLGENYPQVHERFSSRDLLDMRRDVMDEFSDKLHDFRFLRKKVLARVAVESGYDEDMVEPAFDVFDQARNVVELYPDVLPDLEMLYEQFTIVALTNGNANLQTIGIAHLFHGVVTATETGVAKPGRPIFDAAIREAGVSPAEVLHVGDHPETDIDGARRAGMRTAWINRNGDDWPEHLDSPDAVITTITELRELLEAAR
jgi:putative hydrolase of the HAD superfamily